MFEHSSILFEIYESNTEQDYGERQLKEAFLHTQWVAVRKHQLNWMDLVDMRKDRDDSKRLLL